MSNLVKVMRHGRPIPIHSPVVVEVGVCGLPGPRGKSLKFEDLTEEQKLELKGVHKYGDLRARDASKPTYGLATLPDVPVVPDEPGEDTTATLGVAKLGTMTL